MAIPSSGSGAVVDLVFHGGSHLVDEESEAFEFGVVGDGGGGAFEGDALDVGGGTEAAFAGGGGDAAFLGRREADGGRDGRGAHALRV